MKICPYCGNELPDDKNAIYCIKCDHIIDDDIILRKKIEKELKEMQPSKTKEKVQKNHKQPIKPDKTNDQDYIPRIHFEEEKSYANIILIAIVVIVILYLSFR